MYVGEVKVQSSSMKSKIKKPSKCQEINYNLTKPNLPIYLAQLFNLRIIELPTSPKRLAKSERFHKTKPGKKEDPKMLFGNIHINFTKPFISVT
jgi:hypothetical protein